MQFGPFAFLAILFAIIVAIATYITVRHYATVEMLNRWEEQRANGDFGPLQTEALIDDQLKMFEKTTVSAHDVPVCYGITNEEFPPPMRIVCYERFACHLFVIYSPDGGVRLIIPDW